MQHISEQKPETQVLPSIFADSSLLVSGMAILALMSGWGIFLYLGIGSLVSFEPPQPPPKPTPPDPSRPTVNYDEKEAALVLQLQRAELTARIEELESQIRMTGDSASRLGERMAALRTSDSGRRLATSDTARRFLFLSSYPGNFDSDAMRQIVFGLKEKIETARQPLGDMNYFHAAFAGIQSDLESSQRELEIVSSAIDQLLRENTVAQPMTLQEAIDRLAAADADAVQQAVDGKLQKERDMQAAQLKTETDRKVMLESDVQGAKSNLADTEKQARQQIDSANRSAEETKQAREAELTQAVARMKAAYPAVRDLLAPFTTPGYRQISPTNRLETTAEKQPLSYTGLLRKGVLENTDRGIEDLFYLVQPFDAGGQNDRSMGAFPEYNAENSIKDASTREKVKQAQAFVRLHGAAMVRTGLLSE